METDVSALASTHSISIEMAGRKARHAFFSSLLNRLGHHANDQVETFLLRPYAGQDVAG